VPDVGRTLGDKGTVDKAANEKPTTTVIRATPAGRAMIKPIQERLVVLAETTVVEGNV
jgi:hypothetical protein